MLNRLPTPVQLPSLALMLDDLGQPGVDKLAAALGVTPRTVRRWLADGMAPRPAMLALFWVTRWGLSLVDAEAARLADLHAAEADCLRREVSALRDELARVLAVGDFGAANDASLSNGPRPPRPRPALQIVTA